MAQLMSVEVVRDLAVRQLSLPLLGRRVALRIVRMRFVLMLARLYKEPHLIEHQIWY